MSVDKGEYGLFSALFALLSFLTLYFNSSVWDVFLIFFGVLFLYYLAVGRVPEEYALGLVLSYLVGTALAGWFPIANEAVSGAVYTFLASCAFVHVAYLLLRG